VRARVVERIARMADRLLIYGANGYTGTLIARLAAQKKLEPILAGRDREAVARLASSLRFAHRAFALTDPAAVDEGLEGIAAVLHCAGPFSLTADPMVEACLRRHVHYLDITGELTVFESHAAKDAQARAAGVMLLSGAGLDIVPSDCLAAHLKSRLPGATHLTLGLDAAPSISRGTVKTMIESFHRGVVRENGRLVSVPAGLRTRTIDMGRGLVRGTAVPWGDVSTAYYSTGIPNIEVYVSTPPGTAAVSWLMRRLAWLLDLRPVQSLLKAGARLRPAGPTEAQRRSGSTHVWGEAHDGRRAVTSRLRAPEGYTLTAHTALEIATRVLRGDVKPGFQTPSSAYGADLILAVPGCTRSDEPESPLRDGGAKE
jgi:short subunit dehydrogenase-like uncharacterized protein